MFVNFRSSPAALATHAGSVATPAGHGLQTVGTTLRGQAASPEAKTNSYW